MSKRIGRAADFYRLRVTAVDTTDAVDFEWRDDILYRRPPSQLIEDEQSFVVEAVVLDDDSSTVTLGAFGDSRKANEWMYSAADDLDEMTKSEFEAAYFPGDELSE